MRLTETPVEPKPPSLLPHATPPIVSEQHVSRLLVQTETMIAANRGTAMTRHGSRCPQARCVEVA